MGQTSRVCLLFVAFCVLSEDATRSQDEKRPHLRAANDTARWIASVAVKTEHGVRWPASPARPRSLSDDLYAGASGVLLFLVELHAASGDGRWLELARRGADDIVARLDTITKGPVGLYTGSAGVGFALEALHDRTKDDRYQRAAKRIRRSIAEHAKKAQGGVEWGPVTDIISGTAGTGLWLARDEATLPLAVKAGDRLRVLANKTEHGLSWRMSPTYQRLMPNFSHGTAGVAYFLADLYRRTGEERFRQAAILGARHLIAIGNDESGLKIHHHSPGGEDLYYMGWCHGPPGTARLFWILAEATKDEEWRARAMSCADAVVASGIPDRRTPGFWETVGQCCGTAGVADFLLSLHAANRDKRWLEACRPFTNDLMKRATRDGNGLHWIQAEHRVRPKLLEAQTGWAQGAAGIGMWFLRRDAVQQGRKAVVRLPDAPW